MYSLGHSQAAATDRDALPFGDDEIALAIRHHQRALCALVGSGQFGTLPATTRTRLIAQLQRDLAELEARREQAGESTPQPFAPAA